MKCKYCKTQLSAGDISLIPKNNDLTDIDYVMICSSCDKTQPNKIVEKNGYLLVVDHDEE